MSARGKNVPIWKRRSYMYEMQESFRAKEEIRRIKDVKFTKHSGSGDYYSRDFQGLELVKWDTKKASNGLGYKIFVRKSLNQLLREQ